MLESLRKEAGEIGKSEWRPMLAYLADLHERAIHPPSPPFIYPWEEIGPGYCYGPAFGHWDIVHQIMDVLPAEPEHARNQILNDLQVQTEDGMVPGSIWMPGPPAGREQPKWSTAGGHPPLWQVAVQALYYLTDSTELIERCYEPLTRQIRWFEEKRKARSGGFYYLDIVNRSWESGMDEGIRFNDLPDEPMACVDASSHVYWLYSHAEQWALILGNDEEASEWSEKVIELEQFVRDGMFDEETGFFHDIWSVGNPEKRVMAIEGMWPMIVGITTADQAERVIDDNLLNPKRFFTDHPVATVSVDDPRFELRCWRGPAWNSMTYWAARGCMEQGRPDAAAAITERALDQSAAQFDRTGTIWEFYHPFGGNQEDVQRKPHTKMNIPCRDYLGHNPLFAMARMWEKSGK